MLEKQPVLCLAHTRLRIDYDGNDSKSEGSKVRLKHASKVAVAALATSLVLLLTGCTAEQSQQLSRGFLPGTGNATNHTESTTTVAANGQWSLVPQQNLGASNTLYAVQTDAAGNTSAASANLRVAYDSAASAPSVVLQAASDTGVLGDGITANPRPVLQPSAVSSAASATSASIWGG